MWKETYCFYCNNDNESTIERYLAHCSALRRQFIIQCSDERCHYNQIEIRLKRMKERISNKFCAFIRNTCTYTQRGIFTKFIIRSQTNTKNWLNLFQILFFINIYTYTYKTYLPTIISMFLAIEATQIKYWYLLDVWN